MSSEGQSTNSMLDGNAAEWLTAGRFALLLAVLLTVTFPQVLLGINAFSYLDSGLFAYPAAFYHREAFWHGELPLWNPLNDCGIPFLAQWNTLTLYPLSLVYLLLPLPWSFGLFCVGHLFLAGMGMYYLAWRWTASRLGAALAGAVYGFNGLMWYGLMWPSMIAAAAWMPWVVLAMQAAWRRGRQSVIVAGLAAAVQMLTGGVEFIAQTWLFLGVLWLHELFARKVVWTRLVIRGVVPGFIAMTVAAAQLLPFQELLAQSQRSTGFGHSDVAAMPLSGWANYLVPLFHFCRNVQGIFVPPKLSWTGSWYLGVGTVLLALWGAWKVRERRVWLLCGVAVFGLVMALGKAGVVYGLLERAVPLLGLIRFPVKFVLLATFTLPLIAAFGLRSWEQASTGEQVRDWKGIKSLAAVLLVLIAGIVWLAYASPLPKDDLRATVLSAATRGVFLALVVGFLGLLRHGKTRAQRVLMMALVALTWADVYTHSSNLSPTVTAEALQPDSIRDYFKWGDQLRAGNFRALLSGGAVRTLLMAGSPNPEIDTQGRRMSLYMDYNLLDHVPKCDGSYSVELGYYDAIRSLDFLTNEAAGFKDFLGVAYVNNPTNVTEWLRRQTALPLITGGQKPIFADHLTTLRTILGDSFDPLRAVYLPVETEHQVRANGAAVRVLSQKFSTQNIEVEADAAERSLLVIAQSYYHRWRAYVDGTPVPIWRANFGFQALEIPVGRHRVQLRYRDSAFLLGTTVSVASLLGCAGAWLRLRRGGVPKNGGVG